LGSVTSRHELTIVVPRRSLHPFAPHISSSIARSSSWPTPCRCGEAKWLFRRRRLWAATDQLYTKAERHGATFQHRTSFTQRRCRATTRDAHHHEYPSHRTDTLDAASWVNHLDNSLASRVEDLGRQSSPWVHASKTRHVAPIDGSPTGAAAHRVSPTRVSGTYLASALITKVQCGSSTHALDMVMFLRKLEARGRWTEAAGFASSPGSCAPSILRVALPGVATDYKPY